MIITDVKIGRAIAILLKNNSIFKYPGTHIPRLFWSTRAAMTYVAKYLPNEKDTCKYVKTTFIFTDNSKQGESL